MEKQLIGGFTVKDLGTMPTKKEETAKCWNCGKYDTLSSMQVKGNRNYCKTC